MRLCERFDTIVSSGALCSAISQAENQPSKQTHSATDTAYTQINKLLDNASVHTEYYSCVSVHLECAQQIYTNWKRKIMNGEARNDDAMGKCKKHTHSVGQSIQILILNYFMFLNNLTVAHFHCRICSLMLLTPHYLPHSLHLLGIGWVWAAFRIHLFIW